MKKVFILQNQQQAFLNKHNEWIDGREPNLLYRTPHKDEAINQMFEVSSKDYTLRVHLLECPLSDRNQPLIDEEHLPPLNTDADTYPNSDQATAEPVA